MSHHVQVTRIDGITPRDAFSRLAGRPGVFWLDSSLRRVHDARFSVMGCMPQWTFSARDGAYTLIHRDGRVEAGVADALGRLDSLLDRGAIRPAEGHPDLPFFGGAVGWLSYDLGRQFEHLGGATEDVGQPPDIRLAWYDAALVWDHLNDAVWSIGIDAVRSAEAARSELVGWLKDEPLNLQQPVPRACRARSNLSRDDYLERVRTIREAISRGEYYQLNLVQRFSCPHDESPAATYLRLREINPAPFSAFLDAGETTVLCTSPERFLEVTPGRVIRTCPIKGTRSRGATGEEDRTRRVELLASDKERAELLMIVDLLRNDLGRVCVPGTVEVHRLHALESFATVHHLVGEVRGTMRSDVSRRELLRAVFPGGSITGAPKVSAMRAIERLEPDRRGIGMGSIGYFSAHGRIDLNIAIRTVICRAGTADIPVGAGIVWDSEPAAEYEETLAKARALFSALGVDSVEP
ncbi:MAG TPA: aminodeoxychorismate synthase component I [Opitutaceae bacterium]|nr:aminodeoxychorismate synthase component I [Opitutaceae bacterium]